jgi:hypothetical protein
MRRAVSLAASNRTNIVCVSLIVVVHVAIVEIDVPCVVGIVGVRSRRPVVGCGTYPLLLFLYTFSKRVRRPGQLTPLHWKKDTLVPRLHHKALAFACFQAGEGPRDHGALDPASPFCIACRSCPWT